MTTGMMMLALLAMQAGAAALPPAPGSVVVSINGIKSDAG